MKFDSVVFLTWSDWRTEPRSNRYHYATRFARQLPVYFVQPDGPMDEVTFELSGEPNITIVHVGGCDAGQADALNRALIARGAKRPLLWIYNPYFEPFTRAANAPVKILHVTEDYFTHAPYSQFKKEAVQKAMLRLLRVVDAMVGVTEGVIQSYVENGHFAGPTLLLQNGCDFEFWDQTNARLYEAPPDGEKVVLYQGALNARIDYDLLLDLTRRLPDWKFWFCGNKQSDRKLSALLKRSNVRYFGPLEVAEVAELCRKSLVGIIPFVQDKLMRISLPLKAYEYVACGLPVVTMPIDALAERSDLFRIERTAEGFAAAIVEIAPGRHDPVALAARRDAARSVSYDHTFARLLQEIPRIMQCRSDRKIEANVAVFYDDWWTHIATLHEHLSAFLRYSRHSITLIPGAGTVPGLDEQKYKLTLDSFDAVLIHYSVRLSLENHISAGAAAAIAAYNGPKVLFIQDEYENTYNAQRWIKTLGISAIFTTVPLDQVTRVYPAERFGHIDFVPTLTGYVPESPKLDLFARPLSERRLMIGYRGRQLPFQYGNLGHEKYRIGIEMRRLAEARGIAIDIEVDDHQRIYGEEWYAFLGRCRATLGTESGANIFDFDGTLKALSEQHRELGFAEFHDRFLSKRDGEIRMNQVSPKIFEAIRLRTALILFEGEYSGFVKPDVHFIPLKKDFSNVEEVFDKIADDAFLTELTDRAYRDVIESERFSYREFIHSVDSYLDLKLPSSLRAKLLSVPVFAVNSDGEISLLWPSEKLSRLTGKTLLGGNLTREKLGQQIYGVADAEPTILSVVIEQLRWIWARLPPGVRKICLGVARIAWRMLPRRVRYRFSR
jgi:glycosyltransferase involved in cell wall biosynthesis